MPATIVAIGNSPCETVPAHRTREPSVGVQLAAAGVASLPERRGAEKIEATAGNGSLAHDRIRDRRCDFAGQWVDHALSVGMDAIAEKDEEQVEIRVDQSLDKCFLVKARNASRATARARVAPVGAELEAQRV